MKLNEFNSYMISGFMTYSVFIACIDLYIIYSKFVYVS